MCLNLGIFNLSIGLLERSHCLPEAAVKETNIKEEASRRGLFAERPLHANVLHINSIHVKNGLSAEGPTGDIVPLCKAKEEVWPHLLGVLVVAPLHICRSVIGCGAHTGTDVVALEAPIDKQLSAPLHDRKAKPPHPLPHRDVKTHDIGIIFGRKEGHHCRSCQLQHRLRNLGQQTSVEHGRLGLLEQLLRARTAADVHECVELLPCLLEGLLAVRECVRGFVHEGFHYGRHVWHVGGLIGKGKVSFHGPGHLVHGQVTLQQFLADKRTEWVWAGRPWDMQGIRCLQGVLDHGLDIAARSDVEATQDQSASERHWS
mmetsp:Transcript_94914/g.264034  ORF Transcript_94914/g.264034 Transcript_94914/m.264034 type:complete len:316 (+) Transcript_94914:502-1449(+)